MLSKSWLTIKLIKLNDHQVDQVDWPSARQMCPIRLVPDRDRLPGAGNVGWCRHIRSVMEIQSTARQFHTDSLAAAAAADAAEHQCVPARALDLRQQSVQSNMVTCTQPTKPCRCLKLACSALRCWGGFSRLISDVQKYTTPPRLPPLAEADQNLRTCTLRMKLD